MVPTISLRHSNSSGVVTMISLGMRIPCSATPISTALSCFDPFTGITTRRSTSLSGPPSPRACEPNRMTFSGWNRYAMRSTICRIVLVISLFDLAIPHPPTVRSSGEDFCRRFLQPGQICIGCGFEVTLASVDAVADAYLTPSCHQRRGYNPDMQRAAIARIIPL